MQEEKLVLLVAIQSRRNLYYIKPEALLDREPVIFRTVLKDNRILTTGPYCAVTFSPERKKRSCWSYKREKEGETVNER